MRIVWTAIVRETFALTNRHLIRAPASEGVLRLISNVHHSTAEWYDVMCRAGQKERSDICQHRLSGQVLENRLVITPARHTHYTDATHNSSHLQLA